MRPRRSPSPSRRRSTRPERDVPSVREVLSSQGECNERRQTGIHAPSLTVAERERGAGHGSIRRECLDHVIVASKPGCLGFLPCTWRINISHGPICHWPHIGPDLQALDTANPQPDASVPCNAVAGGRTKKDAERRAGFERRSAAAAAPSPRHRRSGQSFRSGANGPRGEGRDVTTRCSHPEECVPSRGNTPLRRPGRHRPTRPRPRRTTHVCQMEWTLSTRRSRGEGAITSRANSAARAA